MTTNRVSGLWVENTLSRLERLSIQSYLANGHAVDVYTYADRLDGLPDGARLRDAREILPDDWRARDPQTVSLAGVADLFRYRFLHQVGGTWSDLDIICLRPLPDDRIILVSEGDVGDQRATSNQFMRLPAGDPLAAYLLDQIDLGDKDVFRFLTIGPWLVHKAVGALGYQRFVKPANFVNPIPTYEWHKPWLAEHGPLLDAFDRQPDTHAVHLWHEHVRRTGLPKSAPLDPACLIARLEQRFALHPRLADSGTARVRAIALWAQSKSARLSDQTQVQPNLERAVASDPGYAPALKDLLATAPDAANRILRKCAADGHVETAGWLSAVRVLRQQKQDHGFALDAAIARFDTASDADIAAVLALKLADDGADAVAPLLDRLLPNRRESAPLRVIAARLALARKTPADALAALSGLSADDPDVAALSAQAQLALSRPDAALPHAEHAARQDPSVRNRLLLAETLIALDRGADAVALLKAILRARPGHRRAARLLEKLGH